MRTVYAWALAVLITLGAVFLQRSTGPGHARKESLNVLESSYKASFPQSLVRPRSGSPETQLTVTLKAKETGWDPLMGALLHYRRTPGTDDFTTVIPSFTTDKNTLFMNSTLPVQPAAGKVEYYIQLIAKDGTIIQSNSSVLRFRNYVPPAVLILHILLMFFAYLFSNFTGLHALNKQAKTRYYALTALLLILAGGFILGPIVQKYAFNVWWAGWPLGRDMTDNKTLVAFLAWLIAYIINRLPRWKPSATPAAAQTTADDPGTQTTTEATTAQTPSVAPATQPPTADWRRYLYLAAALITLVVYSIPHSTAGSQYDYSTGTVTTQREVQSGT
ncbi:MAG: hypothetical protein GX877_01285 [Bacteroidales bacterium]|nr:hypothetical protein [Bacteroidales bacterium]